MHKRYRLTREQKEWENKQKSLYYSRQKQERKAWAEINRGPNKAKKLSWHTKEQYWAMLKSPWWQYLRKRKINKHPYCDICKGKTVLQIHHISYDNMWSGNPEDALKDTIVLCRSCHLAVHKEQHRLGLKWSDTKDIISKFKEELVRN